MSGECLGTPFATKFTPCGFSNPLIQLVLQQNFLKIKSPVCSVGGKGRPVASSGGLCDAVSMTEANLKFFWKLALAYILDKKKKLKLLSYLQLKLPILHVQAQLLLCELAALERRNTNCTYYPSRYKKWRFLCHTTSKFMRGWAYDEIQRAPCHEYFRIPLIY